MTVQMKATEQYFPVTLFILLYRVALTFESVDEIVKCYHSNKGTLQHKVVLTFESVDEILQCDHSFEWSYLDILN